MELLNNEIEILQRGIAENQQRMDMANSIAFDGNSTLCYQNSN
jgi:hypothetical protein